MLAAYSSLPCHCGEDNTMQLGAHVGLKRNLVEPHGYTKPAAQDPGQASGCGPDLHLLGLGHLAKTCYPHIRH